MQTEYSILITLGVLLILSPFMKSLMERIGVPARVGHILLGFIISLLDQHWAFITTAFDNTFAVLAQLLVDIAELDDLSGVLLLAILLAIIPLLQGSGEPILPPLGLTSLMISLKLVLFITGCYPAFLTRPLHNPGNRMIRKPEVRFQSNTICLVGRYFVPCTSVASLCTHLPSNHSYGYAFQSRHAL